MLEGNVKEKSKMGDYCIMMLTCDKYSDLWPAYFGQIHKYWNSYNGKIFVNTERIRKFDFECNNQISFSKKLYDWDTPWSYRLKDCLEQVEEQYVIFLLDDFILTDYVDANEIDNCVDHMKEEADIACFNFLPTPGKKNGKKYDRYELTDRNMPFRINLQAALWRKDFLMKFIREHENPWQFEYWGSIRARRYKERIYHLSKDADKVFVYPDGGVIADERWFGEIAIEILQKEGYFMDFSKRKIYHKGEPRKTEIVHRNFFEKCWQVFKSLI